MGCAELLACGEATVASAVPSHSSGPLLGFPFSDPMFAVLFLTWLRATVQHQVLIAIPTYDISDLTQKEMP